MTNFIVYFNDGTHKVVTSCETVLSAIAHVKWAEIPNIIKIELAS